MKKIIVSVLLLTLTAPSYALNAEEKESFCSNMMDMSSLIMRARLAGMPVTDAMAILSKSATEKEKAVYMMMLRDAYTSPSYRTEEFKQTAIKDFGAKYYLKCMADVKVK